jgi:hypothetical protein
MPGVHVISPSLVGDSCGFGPFIADYKKTQVGTMSSSPFLPSAAVPAATSSFTWMSAKLPVDRLCVVLSMGVLSAAIFSVVVLASREQYVPKDSRHKCRVRDLINARIGLFASAMPLWIVVFYFCTNGFEERRPLVLLAGLVVLVYMCMEVKTLDDFEGSIDDIEGGSNESPVERSVRVSVIAFSLGTLLLSQKDSILASNIASLVFLGLFLCIMPSLATGAAAKRRSEVEPYFAAIQRVLMTCGAGIMAVALARCISEVRFHSEPNGETP